jgi:hypothetical protein
LYAKAAGHPQCPAQAQPALAASSLTNGLIFGDRLTF